MLAQKKKQKTKLYLEVNTSSSTLLNIVVLYKQCIYSYSYLVCYWFQTYYERFFWQRVDLVSWWCFRYRSLIFLSQSHWQWLNYMNSWNKTKYNSRFFVSESNCLQFFYVICSHLGGTDFPVQQHQKLNVQKWRNSHNPYCWVKHLWHDIHTCFVNHRFL